MGSEDDGSHFVEFIESNFPSGTGIADHSIDLLSTFSEADDVFCVEKGVNCGTC